MMILMMRAIFLISLFSLLGIQARPLLEHGYSSMVESNYGRTPTPPPKPYVQTEELSSAPAVKSPDKVLFMMTNNKERTISLQLVQPSSETVQIAIYFPRVTDSSNKKFNDIGSLGGIASLPPPPKPASTTHYEADNGSYQSPPNTFLASS